MKKNFQFKETFAVIIAFIVIAVIVCRSLFADHLLVSDDYLFHAARTANYYLALKQGQFPPRWAPNLNASFGYPTFLYTYHLPYAVAAVIHSLHFSIQQSLNVTIFLFMVIGMLGGYSYAKYKRNSHVLSASLGIVYIVNPYILLNIFWRGAVGEIAFYSLLPYFFWLVDVVIENKRNKLSGLYILLLAVLLSFLILSHVISLIPLGLIVSAYVLLKTWPWSTHFTPFIKLAVAVVLAFLLNAWYLLPAQLEKNLIQFESSKIATIYQHQFLHIRDVLDLTRTLHSSDFFLQVIQIGPLLYVVLVSLIWLIIKKNNFESSKKYTWLWSSVLVISLALTLAQSRFLWDALGFLRIMQFPWRFLWLSNVAMFFLLIENVKNFSKKEHIIITIVLLVSAAWSAWAYAQPKGFFSRSDYEWYEADTTGSSFNEFTPVGAESGYDVSTKVMVEDDPSSAINIETWNGTTMVYTVSVARPSVVVQHTLYFPGWQVKVDNREVPILVDHTNYPGLIVYQLESGTHAVQVSFSGSTPVRQAGIYLSYFGCIGAVAILTWNKRFSKLFK